MKPCDGCGGARTTKGNRLCKACAKAAMAQAYADGKIRAWNIKPISDQRGRKCGRSAHRLGEEADTRAFDSEVEGNQ